MSKNKQTAGQGRDPAFPRLLGERLCLDFVNTVEGPRGAHPEEFLRDYADLARWGRHVGALDDAATATLLAAAAARPAAAGDIFARALELRAALAVTFRAIAHGEEPGATELDLIRAAYLDALARARLAPGADGFAHAWTWADAAPDALDRPLWAVARSAIELLTTGDPARLKECPGANDCGWLFYDTSKNGSRRWCSMEGCGSRVKMRHQYARKHAVIA